MVQAVSGRTLTEEIRVRTQATPREIFGGPSGSGIRFSKGLSIFSYQYRSINVPYSSSSIRFSYQMDTSVKTMNLPKGSVHSQIGQ
jgi:hypothetical protein